MTAKATVVKIGLLPMADRRTVALRPTPRLAAA